MSILYQEYPDEDKGVIEIYKNINGIQEKFFPNDIKEIVDAVLDELIHDEAYINGKWKVWPEEDSDSVDTKCIEMILDKIIALVQDINPPQRGRLLYCKSSSTPEIMVPIIIEPSKHDDLKVWRKLSHVIRFIFNSQDSRRYVQALTISGSKWRLWVYDRSGAFSSTLFDINIEWKMFVEVIIGYYMMTDNALGFDSSIFYNEVTKSRHVKLPGPNVPIL